PPGPRGLPLIGNALVLRDKVWLFQRDCTQKYGDVMYLNALGQPILVLNSLKAASELLDRRADIYSGRPRLIMAQEIVSGGLIFALINHVDDYWRRSRRAAHQVLTKAAVRGYHNILRKESVLLTSALLANPGAVEPEIHLQRTATSATSRSISRYSLGCCTSPKGSLSGSMKETEILPDSITCSSLFSIVFWALCLRVPSDQVYVHRSSKASTYNQLSRQEMAWFAGTLFVAGSETTSTTMSWWALAMIAHPEVQKRAHIELDTVVGRSRTPTFSDAPNLPYIQAIVKEVLRWRPALPFSLPHSTMEDDWYNGMFIPKGTICLTNLLQCHRDPTSYGDDAASFRPERFLGAHGEILPGPAETHEEGHSTFGFGKRTCMGKHIVNESLFVYIATALWAVTFDRVRDEDGNQVPLDADVFVDTGMSLKPGPYECRIMPRFDEVVSILAAEEELLNT
ncbi:cytochrome P450, partial [Lactarius hengduanensis]